MSLPPVETSLGAMRFNSDSQKLEYWNGSAWFQIHTFSPNLDGGVRGLFFGGDPSRDTNMDYITIPTRGNSIDFGDYPISNGTGARGVIASNTRGFGAGGESPSAGDSHNVIAKFDFSSTGSAIDFANLTFTMKGGAGCSNATRGIVTRGYGAPAIAREEIDFFTMASQQNAIDFGDLQSGASYLGCGTASPTRGVIITGRDTSGQANIIEFVTISTTGDATDFGDTPSVDNAVASCAGGNSTRGVIAGGGDSAITDITYITYASTGNAIKFGDLHTGNSYQAPASDRITLVTAGGTTPSNPTNRMDAIAIATGGTSTDFGDLTVSKTGMCGSSNGHGGLG